jgi:hypothetical protein
LTDAEHENQVKEDVAEIEEPTAVEPTNPIDATNPKMPEVVMVKPMTKPDAEKETLSDNSEVNELSGGETETQVVQEEMATIDQLQDKLKRELTVRRNEDQPVVQPKVNTSGNESEETKKKPPKQSKSSCCVLM